MSKCENLTVRNNFEILEHCEADADVIMRVGKGKAFKMCVEHGRELSDYAHEEGLKVLARSLMPGE